MKATIHCNYFDKRIVYPRSCFIFFSGMKYDAHGSTNEQPDDMFSHIISEERYAEI
jgi:hypothetical protein